MCSYAPNIQPRFYRELAADVSAVRILDVGRGTGIIIRDLANQRYSMVALDPAPFMVNLAHQKSGGDATEHTKVAGIASWALSLCACPMAGSEKSTPVTLAPSCAQPSESVS